MNASLLEKTTKEFLDSLLASKTRHTLCLNIAEPGFLAEDVARKHVSKLEIDVHHEPEPPAFKELLAALTPETLTVVTFDDLDKHPKCIAALLKHVKKQAPKPAPKKKVTKKAAVEPVAAPAAPGKLVIVSKEWNSDNTARERELRKFCLFYQQNLAVPPKAAKR
jgi:hypothetical protein